MTKSRVYALEQDIMDNEASAPRGRFIVFEGLDGSGKGVQVGALISRMREDGRRVFGTAEPTDSAIGGLIRDTLAGNFSRSPEELAALFLADRLQHNLNPHSGIQKSLFEGMDVVCDRYYYSSLAYQGFQADPQWVMDMNLNSGGILKPDICIFLDLDPEACRERMMKGRARLEMFEDDLDAMKRIRAQFLRAFELLKNENIKLVNAARPPEAIAAEIYALVRELY